MAMDMSYLMSMLGFFTLARGFLPPELNDLIQKWWEKFIRPVNPFCVFHIPENESNMQNDLYRVVQMHLSAAKLCSQAEELVLSRDEGDKDITYNLAGGESVPETFEGVTVWWTHSRGKSNTDKYGNEDRQESEFTLKMRKKDKQFVMNNYLEHVAASAAEYRRQLRELFLYSNNDSYWESHNFKHPSTFDTLAMEPELKEKVKADLQSFLTGEKFFRKVGRAWKRGYLLYGPPGTGKSSMIAAMANYLKYNIYDLELTQVYNNNALKQLLVNTTSKSIIVIEDIDCSLDLAGQRKTGAAPSPPGHKNETDNSVTSSVTLSGLLNFTDGLWSCCGDERIIIFTTNHVEKLDAALLRPGRMDMHIHMSYCSFEVFKSLASNYLSIESHPLYTTVRDLLETGVLITPAQVTEHLFGNKHNPTAAIEAVIAWLQNPEEVKEETKEEVAQPVQLDNTESTAESQKNKENGSSMGTEELQTKVIILEEKVRALENVARNEVGTEEKVRPLEQGKVLAVENGVLLHENEACNHKENGEIKKENGSILD